MTDLPFGSAAHVYSEMFRFTSAAVEAWRELYRMPARNLYFKLKVQL